MDELITQLRKGPIYDLTATEQLMEKAADKLEEAQAIVVLACRQLWAYNAYGAATPEHVLECLVKEVSENNDGN